MGGGAMAGNDGLAPNKKQNHCDIERRRREKMNRYITELASVLPAFNSTQSKLDKLTVLRMAVQHVKSLRSSLCSFSSFHLRPSFLSSGNLLKNLILQMVSQEAQDNLFMVVTCDRGKVLFVSKSSKDILNQSQHELVGQSLFDILHKDDVSKVKEQISYFNLMPKEMLVDSKTLQPIKSDQRESFIQLQNQARNSTLQPGSRRSFFCRMKSGKIWVSSSPTNSPPSSRAPSSSTSTSTSTNTNTNTNTNTSISSNGGALPTPYTRKQWRYIVMHCTGYLKSITLRNDEYDDDDFDARTPSTVAAGANVNSDDDDDDDDDLDDDEDHNDNNQGRKDDHFRTVNCLVAVCRRSLMDRNLKPHRPLTFTCRYSMEGKFTFVDQRTTVALGYTPQQLIGTSHYAYCHKDFVNTFKQCHRQCILKSESVSSDIYQFKRANGQHLWLQTSLKSFRNPWTKFIDYIVANHTTAEGNDPRYNEGCVPTKFNQDMTGENSQSSSPASSSSLQSSVDCKKSASPSSSSIASSCSMDSGASIQAVLNQIDRVEPGGLKHSLEFSKKAREHHAVSGSSGGSSLAWKSNDDSGNYSDLKSCSSVSSRNSNASSTGGYVNMQTVSNFVEKANQEQVQALVYQPTTYVVQQQPQQQQPQQQQPQQQQLVPINVIQQTQMSGYFGAQMGQLAYGNEMMQPIDSFMTTDTRFAPDGLAMNHQRHNQQMPNPQIQHSIDLSQQQQQQTSQQQSVERTTSRHDNGNLNIPMLWNSSDRVYQTMNTIENDQQQPVTACHTRGPATNVSLVGMDVMKNCANQMDKMAHVAAALECQQCAAVHKCCTNNQQSVMNNGGNGGIDLNGMHLSSLAVHDIDENELLECLATFDSDEQLYHMPQNNAYPQ